MAHAESNLYPQGALPPNTVLPFGAPPVQDWLALSGKGLIDVWANPFQSMKVGTFVAELRLPLPRGKVLINLQTNRGIPRSFALFAGPDGTLSILHREGETLLRMSLPSAQLGSAARITYRFDSRQGRWQLRSESLDNSAPATVAAGAGGLAFANGDIEEICQKAEIDPAVMWFGFCHSADVPRAAPWIGLRTPIATAQGYVAAGNLKPGDVILTQDRGAQVLRAVHPVNMPARGSFAPILLRAPFYDDHTDILLSADQHIVISGSAVEYLFGVDAVLVAAGDVVDGRTALAEDRRDVISAVRLDLGGPALIGIDQGRIALALGDISQTDPTPLMCLNGYETVALMRMMGRIVSKVA